MADPFDRDAQATPAGGKPGSASFERNDGKKALLREVMPPTKANSGLGVLMVASAAMFFLVAGSAFALRASTADCPYERSASVTPLPAAEVPPDVVAKSAGDHCGGPVYHRDTDGTYTVFFQVCASDTPVIVVRDSD